METAEQLVAGEVRAMLARRRITGRKLSTLLGWTPAYVSRRMTGQIPFSIADLEALATALEVPMSEFLPRPGEGVIIRREWFSRRSLAVAA